MTDHYIVCGLGTVGFRCVLLLCRFGERVTVVTQDARPEWRREAEARGVRVLTGDVRDEHLLVEAGIREARALIAATDNDIANIEVLLDAHRLRPSLPVVIRMFDQTLARQLEAGFDLRRALGTSVLAAPTFAAAALGEQVVGTFSTDAEHFIVGHPTLDERSPLIGCTVDALSRRFGFTVLTRVEDGVDVPAPSGELVLEAGDRVTVIGPRRAWRTIEPEAEAPPERRLRRLRAFLRPFAPRALGQAVVQAWVGVPFTLRVFLIVFAVLITLSFFVFRIGLGLSLVDAFLFTVTTLVTAEQGDVSLGNAPSALKVYGALVMVLGSAIVAVLYAIVTDLIVTARFQQLLGRQKIPREGHVIVAGLGNVGFRVASELRKSGVSVVSIELDPGSRFIETVRAKTPIVIGDARLRHTLKKAGGEHARAVVAATHDDAVNIGIALSARQLNPGARTVVRLFDATFAGKVEANLDVDRAISTSRRAAPTFVASAMYAGVRNAFELDGMLFVAQERPAGDEWHGRSPASLREAKEAVIVSRSWSGEGAEHSPLDRDEKVLAVVWRDACGGESPPSPST